MSLYQSMADTYKHKANVAQFINQMTSEMHKRAIEHDNSKLESPEVEIFAEYGPKLSKCTYMSEEYYANMQKMTAALSHHYSENRHHPEYYADNIELYCSSCNCILKSKEDFDIHASLHEKSGSPRPELKSRSTLKGMSLIDLVEMIADWKSASMRHGDGDIMRSLDLNQERFGYTDELKQILQNTLKYL